MQENYLRTFRQNETTPFAEMEVATKRCALSEAESGLEPRCSLSGFKLNPL